MEEQGRIKNELTIDSDFLSLMTYWSLESQICLLFLLPFIELFSIVRHLFHNFLHYKAIKYHTGRFQRDLLPTSIGINGFISTDLMHKSQCVHKCWYLLNILNEEESKMRLFSFHITFKCSIKFSVLFDHCTLVQVDVDCIVLQTLGLAWANHQTCRSAHFYFEVCTAGTPVRPIIDPLLCFTCSPIVVNIDRNNY